MKKEKLQDIIDSLSSNEGCKLTLRDMFKDFYCSNMTCWVTMAWAYSILFIGLAVYSGMEFFKTDSTKCQIMFAVIFIVSICFIMLVKVTALQIVHRIGICREIAQLKKSIVELLKIMAEKESD